MYIQYRPHLFLNQFRKKSTISFLICIILKYQITKYSADLLTKMLINWLIRY